MRSRSFLALVAVGTICAAAWIGAGGSAAGAAGVETLTATAGTPQYTDIGTAFPDILEVTVGGVPAGAACPGTVTFTGPVSGSGGTFSGTSDSSAAALSANDTTAEVAAGGTTSNGDPDLSGNCYYYAPVITANGQVGPFTVTATAENVPGQVSFYLVNDGISATSGTIQTTRIGTAFSSPLSVSVYQDGAPLAGVPVTFAAPPTGASGLFFTTNTDTATVATGGNGAATAPTLTASEIGGTFTVAATTASFPGMSATFSLTITTAGIASSVTIASGNGQSATVGTTFASALSVTVVDANGSPVQGVMVSFAVVAGTPVAGATGSQVAPGATFEGGGGNASETTNGTGVATSPSLIANTAAGSFTVMVSTSGVITPALFTMTNDPGAPYSVTPGDGASQQAPVGTVFAIPLSVTVEDVYHNPIANTPVIFDLPATGARGTFAGSLGTSITATTDSDGVAVAPSLWANRQPGGYLVTASVHGVSPPTSFSLVNQPLAEAAATLGTLDAPVVYSAATPDGGGYWLVASDGGVFTFGDAGFYGSAGGTPLSSPVVGITPTPDGRGYRLVKSDGTGLNYGDA